MITLRSFTSLRLLWSSSLNFGSHFVQLRFLLVFFALGFLALGHLLALAVGLLDGSLEVIRLIGSINKTPLFFIIFIAINLIGAHIGTFEDFSY